MAEGSTYIEKDGIIVYCAKDAIKLITIKPEGKGEMIASAWANGARIKKGDKFNYKNKTRNIRFSFFLCFSSQKKNKKKNCHFFHMTFFPIFYSFFSLIF